MIPGLDVVGASLTAGLSELRASCGCRSRRRTYAHIYASALPVGAADRQEAASRSGTEGGDRAPADDDPEWLRLRQLDAGTYYRAPRASAGPV